MGNTAHSGSLRQRGVTLIELMVAMVLSLLTTVIIAEVMLKSEGTKRTTSEGADAQTNGALALYAMQREIAMSGYGLVSKSASLGCTIKAQYDTNAVHTFTLAPVVITSSGAAHTSDTITVLRSGGNGYIVPLFVDQDHAPSANAFIVSSSLGVKAGDMMLAIPESPSSTNWCTVFSVSNQGGNVLDATTIPNNASSSSWNPSTSIMPSAGYERGTTLIRLDPLVLLEYTVSNNNLVATSLISPSDISSTETIGSEIVLLKAYYGRDTNGDGSVDGYTATTPSTNAGWLMIKTIRVALVARSAQREKDIVTTADPLWDVGKTVTVEGSSACGSSKCLKLQVSPASGSNDEWKHYRYKVFDTVIPLRNLLWTTQ
jgi:type IV pilus assembly protein PilW